MKNLLLFSILILSLLAGCATPGKLIASSSTTVDHAMRAWAVWVVDGKATPEQELRVRALKAKYDAAEDAAVQANIAFASGDKTRWAAAKAFLIEQQQALLSLVSTLTGRAVR